VSELEFRVDEGKRAELERDLAGIARGAPRVMSGAVNAVAGRVQNEMVERIVSEVNLPESFVRGRRVTLRKATVSVCVATIRVSGKSVPLIYFAARQTPRGVAYAIRRGEEKEVPGAFIREASNSRQVWAREYGAGGRRGRRNMDIAQRVSRVPLHLLRGPALGEILADLKDYTQEAMQERIGAELVNEIDNQVAAVKEGKNG
jgi:hypothetical protein